MEEQVLVIPSDVLTSVGNFLGFSRQAETLLPKIFAPGVARFLPRSLAEDDPTHKQLIPYAILRFEDQFFCYQRSKKGSEQRLHNLSSLGIGGHVCDADGEAGRQAYDVGLARELAEEVRIESPYISSIIGLVHDDRTPVGSVHLGIVHLLTLEKPLVIPVDPALAEAGFRPIRSIEETRDRFETWSGFIINWFIDNSWQMEIT